MWCKNNNKCPVLTVRGVVYQPTSPPCWTYRGGGVRRAQWWGQLCLLLAGWLGGWGEVMGGLRSVARPRPPLRGWLRYALVCPAGRTEGL